LLDNKIKACSDVKYACELGECKGYNIAQSEGFCK